MEETAQVNNPPEVSQPIQTPVENPVPVQLNEKPKRNSGLALILSFTTIVATLIAGFFYFQNTQLRAELAKKIESISTPTPTEIPDETADWNTYTNELFAIKLPLDFKQIEESLNPIQFINYSLDETDGRSYEPLKDKGKLKIEIYTTNISNLDTYVEEQKQQNTELHGSDSKFIVEDINIDSQPAKKISNISPGYYIIVKHPSENKVISISFGLDFGNNFELSDQILSTFKFNEENKNNCTSPRPEVCTQECIVNPPYICGSDGKSYCTTCQACADTKVEWYITQDTACGEK